jgi:hypothetical protein
LQIASIFSLSLLPGLPKTGNYKKDDPNRSLWRLKKFQDATGGLSDQFRQIAAVQRLMPIALVTSWN